MARGILNMNYQEAPKFAIKNRDRLSKNGDCSCYSCLKVYKVAEIKEWTDGQQTALCPYCNIDTVLPDAQTPELLRQMHNYWFSKNG